VDIVIGTHRLLQKDIAFKDLGLVIIDEEQRFGVAHKEKLKKLRTTVDVITMTATPIPRTLHLAMVGIRDMSVINTPPENRLPVKTYVLEFDEETIKEAIQCEIIRGGQVFFLHDRVSSIYNVARFVEKLVPGVRVGVVHGQMKAKEVEDAMSLFIRREHDVLVCTTIIGAGLDIPAANTIIINRADKFGLSQLYQIRGRVGRGREEAVAYLFIPRGMMLSSDARRRLQAIVDFSEPGSALRVANQDLEIRGGGNILGTTQSGHISAVGYELYTELMEQTIRELKGEQIQEEVKPEIHLGVSAFIPEEYMTDVHRRLITYKRLSLAGSEEELVSIKEELIDCYGSVPPEVANLMEVIAVRNMLHDLRGKKMVYDGKNMVVSFHQESNVHPHRILELARSKWPGLRLTPNLQLYVPVPGLKEGEILREAKGILRVLMN
jgi:transcription-repair coupling factor (superfamily II helicase)